MRELEKISFNAQRGGHNVAEERVSQCKEGQPTKKSIRGKTEVDGENGGTGSFFEYSVEVRPVAV